MSNTTAQLGNLLTTNADINYYTQQQIFWANKYEANTAKLQQQTKYYTKWESKFDSFMDTEKEIKWDGKTYAKGTSRCEEDADAYAHDQVEQYNEELSLELAELDVEYDTMKCMYETLIENLRAQQEKEKQSTSTAAQDTGIISGG